MQRTIRAGLAGLLVLAVAAPVADGAVTVRAEGFAQTVLPETAVAINGSNTLANGKSCPTASATGRSAAGALERATAGNWNGASFSFGLTVERILQTNLGGFPSPTYWNFDVDNSSQQVGICDVQPLDGQEILFYEACASSTTQCFTGTPLALTAPATATAGVPFNVTVREFDDSKSPATSTPSVNATIAGGGQSATTAAAGTARFEFATPGSVTLVATKGRQVRDSATVLVQAPPVYEVPTPTATPNPSPAPAPDRTPPVSTIVSPQEGKVFGRGRGPRLLRARVTDDVAIGTVRFALSRRTGNRCVAYEAVSERFRSAGCGPRNKFSASNGPDVSYLLPNRLGKGTYVFYVQGIDAARNREAFERGRNKVVFKVR